MARNTSKDSPVTEIWRLECFLPSFPGIPKSATNDSTGASECLSVSCEESCFVVPAWKSSDPWFHYNVEELTNMAMLVRGSHSSLNAVLLVENLLVWKYNVHFSRFSVLGNHTLWSNMGLVAFAHVHWTLGVSSSSAFVSLRGRGDRMWFGSADVIHLPIVPFNTREHRMDCRMSGNVMERQIKCVTAVSCRV